MFYMIASSPNQKEMRAVKKTVKSQVLHPLASFYWDVFYNRIAEKTPPSAIATTSASSTEIAEGPMAPSNISRNYLFQSMGDNVLGGFAS